MLKLKRIYEKSEENDGYRILVDRLWPRGVPKEKAAINLWLKEIAPSTTLRQWFGHQPDRWVDFQQKYKAELTANKVAFDTLTKVVNQYNPVTLLYAARDTKHNEAVVIRDWLMEHQTLSPEWYSPAHL